MTSGEPPAPPTLARFGGFALIGIGVIAAGFGVVAVMTGGTHNAVDSTHAGGAGTSVLASPPSSSHRLDPPGSRVPSSAGPGAAKPGAATPQAPRIALRVYNNSMIKGLAHRAADQLRQAGYDVTEVGNYPFGIIPTTTVYFQRDTPGQEAQAQQIGAATGAKVEPRFPGIVPATPGLILIVTDDYRGIQHGK